MTEYSFVWIPLAEKLAKEGYRVISYDLYGRGYSDAPSMAYDERVFVSQLSHLLMRLNLGETRINLVGLSLGNLEIDDDDIVFIACFLLKFVCFFHDQVVECQWLLLRCSPTM